MAFAPAMAAVLEYLPIYTLPGFPRSFSPIRKNHSTFVERNRDCRQSPSASAAKRTRWSRRRRNELTFQVASRMPMAAILAGKRGFVETCRVAAIRPAAAVHAPL